MNKNNRRVYFIYAVIALAMLAGMIMYSGMQEFWYDEVYQVGLVGSGQNIGNMFSEYAKLKDYTPPLYALLAYGWLRIVPFSFRYLLLLPETIVACGVFVTALVGKEIGGKKLGLMTEIFAASSSVLVLSAGYEFRSYALYYTAAAIVLYLLVKRIKCESKWCYAAYTAALTLLFYSHYYGCIIISVLFIVELCFVIAKKQKIITLMSYVVSGVLFLPWMILVFVNRTRSLTEFWIQPPDIQAVIELVNYLCSECQVEMFLLCVGLAGCVVSVIAKKRQRNFEHKADSIKIIMPSVVVGVILAMYMYGTIVNPSGGIFYNRYFIGLLPFCYAMMGLTLYEIWNRISHISHNRIMEYVIIAGAVFMMLLLQNGNILMTELKTETKLSYYTSVKVLHEKKDIENSDVVVVTTDNSCVCDGIATYFEKFYDEKPNIVSQYDDNFKELIKKYNKAYVFYGKQTITDETREVFSDYKTTERDKDNRIRGYIKR